MEQSNLHMAWARLFVRMLAKAGITRAVISPGSRSTPLALACWEEPAMKVWVAIDERSAGFFALGQGRATGQASLLLCTSGTAALHYGPAIAEASHAGTPLLVVTADRPWDSYDCSSPQTMDQVKLYGTFVRHYAELGLPEPTEDGFRSVVRIAAQCASRTQWPEPGPVHINARFRKPLEPVSVGTTEPWESTWQNFMEKAPPKTWHPELVPPRQAIDALAQSLREARRPLFVCGPSDGGSWEERAMIDRFCSEFSIPLLAEQTSGISSGSPSENSRSRIQYFPEILADREVAASLSPDLVLQYGLPLVSTEFETWMNRQKEVQRFFFASRGWRDSSQSAQQLLWGSIVSILSQLSAQSSRKPEASWLERWRSLDRQKKRKGEKETLDDRLVARTVLSCIPPDCSFLVSNSTPVRELDRCGAQLDSSARIHHQRGVSGIDGMFSAIAGIHSVSSASSCLLVGDVSAAHDLGSLQLCKSLERSLVLVIVNNQGGEIFRRLPVRNLQKDAFSELFLTAPGVSFQKIAAAFGHEYQRAEKKSVLTSALNEAFSSKKTTIIEAMVNPNE